jgi:hypothetical protein
MFIDTTESSRTSTKITTTSSTSNIALANVIAIIRIESCTEGLKIYFIFTKVFNSQGFKPKSTQISNMPPLAKFHFGHVIHLWMST